MKNDGLWYVDVWIREHDCLKLARQQVAAATASSTAVASVATSNQQDDTTEKEDEMKMDMEAVTSTRSYIRWASLPSGSSFVYNHTYIKGKTDRIGFYVRIYYGVVWNIDVSRNQCKVLILKQQQQQQQQQQRERRSKRSRKDNSHGGASHGAVGVYATATAAATLDHPEIICQRPRGGDISINSATSTTNSWL